MKKLYIFTLLLLVNVAAFAQAPLATYRDAAGWNAYSNPSWSVAGYDILLTQTNITALQLGTSNTVPSLAGILGKTRTASTDLSVAFTTLLAANPVASPYTVWARTVATPVGSTNIYVSSWTNLVVNWVDLPLPPTNLRILVPLP